MKPLNSINAGGTIFAVWCVCWYESITYCKFVKSFSLFLHAIFKNFLRDRTNLSSGFL